MRDMELLLHVHARFLHSHSGEAVHGQSYTVKLFDKDPIHDDLLGEAHPDMHGKVQFIVNPATYRSSDSPMEQRPDLFMAVFHNDEQVFKTPVATDIYLDNDGHFNMTEGEWIDLGTFMI